MIIFIIIALIFLMLLGIYLYVNRSSTCQEDSLPKKKFIFLEKLCDVSKLNEFIARVISEIMDTKDAPAMLAKKAGDNYANSIAILYFDSPQVVETTKKCRVCAGILCEKDANTTSMEAELKALGFTVVMLDYTKGVSRKLHNPVKGYLRYQPTGLQLYPIIERFVMKSADLRESLDPTPSGNIEYAEIINPVSVSFYRPLYRADKFRICTLSDVEEQQATKKT